MGVSGQGKKSISPNTQKIDNDNVVRKIPNKLVYAATHARYWQPKYRTFYTCVLLVFIKKSRR